MAIVELDPPSVLEALGRYRIVDVREPHELEGPLGAIEGAENVPLEEIPHLDVAASERMLLVCRSGKRSWQACEILAERGLREPTNLAGGMIAWNRAALPTRRRAIGSLESLLDGLIVWLAQVSASSREDARARVCGWLEETDGSLRSPTAAAVDHVLARSEETLRESSPPADLDLALQAFRRDLILL
jgi:rhodanese-related sulfurtransferase